MELLRLGSHGPDVALLQTALTRARHFWGIIDGVFGSVTQRGVLDFQNANQLTADAIVGDAVIIRPTLKIH